MQSLLIASALLGAAFSPLALAEGPVHAVGERAHEIAWAAGQAGLDSRSGPGGTTIFEAGFLNCYEPPQLSDEDPPKCVVGTDATDPNDPKRRAFEGWQASSLLEALVHAGARIDQQLDRLWVRVAQLKVTTDGTAAGSSADFNDLITERNSAPVR